MFEKDLELTTLVKRNLSVISVLKEDLELISLVYRCFCAYRVRVHVQLSSSSLKMDQWWLYRGTVEDNILMYRYVTNTTKILLDKN